MCNAYIVGLHHAWLFKKAVRGSEVTSVHVRIGIADFCIY